MPLNLHGNLFMTRGYVELNANVLIHFHFVYSLDLPVIGNYQKLKQVSFLGYLYGGGVNRFADWRIWPFLGPDGGF